MVAISLDTAGAAADIDNVQLTNALGQELLGNGDFSQQLTQWLPVAQAYYVPWHIDNLYLELLIEWGLLGGIVVGALTAWGLASAVWAREPTSLLRPYLAVGLFGALIVGLVSSVLDVPRVTLVFFLLPMMLIECENPRVKPKIV
jgi:O-antigen ligase